MNGLCSHCEFQNPPGMRYCGNCGARLEIDPGNGLSTLAPSPALFVPEQVGAMEGTDLLERFRQAGLEAAGQRRNVTVLFADLAGYTEIAERLDSEDVFELIQEFVRLLANEVYKYEGIVDKLTGDGLMAIFGAPITHENNAERAIRTALDMQAGIAGLSAQAQARLGVELRMRVGLNSGTVVVGGVGSNFMMDYTAIGDTVNLANRLEGAALPGTILASESVYRQTRALFDFQPVPGLALKGIPKPVDAYQVSGLKSQPGRVRGVEGLSAPLIGREAELHRLIAAGERLARQNRGGLILITGEAGIGKTRLAREFKNAAAAWPVKVLEGNSLTYRRSVSYWIILDLLRALLGIGPGAAEAELRQRLCSHSVETLSGRAAETLPYLEQLFSLELSDPGAASRIAYLEAGQLRQQIFLAVRDLLAAEARRRPLVLVFEDLHWADEASLELLLFLLETARTASLLIVAISRPYAEGPLAEIAAWAQKNLKERFVPIGLASLPPNQSEHLLAELLMLPVIPDGLRAQILERAAGIPLYLEEILRMLIDRGALRREADRWNLAPETAEFFQQGGAALGVPDTLQGLILARFDRLDETERHTLQVAAVIGHHFTRPLLEAVLDGDPLCQVRPEALRETLSRLVERDFISLTNEVGDDETYVFRHMLVSEAIYGTLLKRERSRLHGQVGAALEALYAGQIAEQVELLARHYAWSDRADRALHFLILAGQRAGRGSANAQARLSFEAALKLLAKVDHTPEQACRVHTGLGDALLLAGEYPGARSHYSAAAETLPSGTAAARQEQSVLLRKIASSYERQGEYDLAVEHLKRAQASLRAAPGVPAVLDLPGSRVENARVLNDLGWIHFRRGSLDEAETLFLNALNLVESTPQYDLTASIYNRLGGIYFQKDQLDQASRFVRKSLVLREEIGDVVAVARSYNNLGLLGWKQGDWDGALEAFNHSVKLHADLGDAEGMINVHGNLGLLHLDRGDTAAAQEHLEQALGAAQEAGNTYHVGMVSLHLSRLYVATGDWRRALEFGHRSIEILNEIGAQEPLPDLYTNIGQARLGLGDLERAREWAGRACAWFGHEPDGERSPARGRALRLLGDVLRSTGALEEAGSHIKESASIFAALGDSLEFGRCNLSLAALAVARGDATRARLLLNEARLIFRGLGAQLDLQQLEEAAAGLIS